MTKDLNERIQDIIDAPTEDFAELLKIAGLDPKKALRFADWSGADFGNADVAGWDFTGAKLNEANLSRVINIDKAFFNLNGDPNSPTEFVGTILPENVTVEQLMI